MGIIRRLPISDFKQMCADQREEKVLRLANGGKSCEECKGTGTRETSKAMTLFGCRYCSGIGALASDDKQLGSGE